MRPLDREILRLALPSILANLSVPLVGFADLAIAGHLHEGAAAASIAAVSVGALVFSVLYWPFAFLRASTGGLTAQAFGRGDDRETGIILGRGLTLALLCSLVLIVFQWPFGKLGMLLLGGSEKMSYLALRYFFVRIWAAPATMSLMVLRGWFIGLQDSASSMWTDLVVNLGNIAASLLLVFPFGLGFDGIALGTVIAQYCGLAFALLVVWRRYSKRLAGLRLRDCMEGAREFLSVNGDLFLRSLCFMGVYFGYSAIAARFGDTALAVSSLMMNLLMVFSYFTDGFAYAGEALSGRFIGEGSRPMLRATVLHVFAWSMGVAVLWMGIYAFAGGPLLRLMTDSAEIRQAAARYMPWLILMPPLGCAAFTWDGI
ncbi:MAG: MATE family efflux transporter, partial [Bacteroidales bacterium]|nr:MATE family efflux transporter [Bacteroidales bacterium]